MDSVRFVSFAVNEREVIALLMALRSLKVTKIAESKPLVFIPKPVIDAFEAKFPDLPIRNLIQGLGAKLTTPFPNGYNEKIGFRNALKNIGRRIDEGTGMIYFSPTIIFRELDISTLMSGPLVFTRSDDEYWPHLSLYDPTLDEFWRQFTEYAGADFGEWIDDTQPENYWRRYPVFNKQLFYVEDVASFVEQFDQISEVLQKETPRIFEGMNPDHAEAALTMTAIGNGATLVDVKWGENIYGYIDIYDLVLRLNTEQHEWLTRNIVRTNDLRGLIKTIDEYRIVFFQNKLVRIREGFDEIEQNFSMSRMQTLIANRKIRQRIRQAARKLESDAQETTETEKAQSAVKPS